MEMDLLNSDRLLFSDSFLIRFTDGETSAVLFGSNEEGYVEGKATDARFAKIMGFIQFNTSIIMAIDHKNHCLRLLDRTLNRTSPFIGNCTNSGFADGKGVNAKFSRPNAAVIFPADSSKALVADPGNTALREVDLTQNSVRTTYQHTKFRYLWSLSFSPMQNDVLFLAIDGYIGQLNTENYMYSNITGEFSYGGYSDGTLSEARFNYPESIVALSSTLIIVADYFNNILRLVDIDRNRVSSICSDDDSTEDIFSQSCDMNRPNALLHTTEHLFVAEFSAIKIIERMYTSAL